MKLQRRLAALSACTLVLAGAAQAQTMIGSPARGADAELRGTLAKVRTSGTIALGYRENSVPFSYLSVRKEPIGYSVELCKSLVTSIEDAVNKSLKIDWVPVTAESRIDDVTTGRIDLECGSTTANLERQKRVAFSPIMFVAGVKVMVRQGNQSIGNSFRDLAGKKVAVAAGTTAETALRNLNTRFKLGIQVQVESDYAESFAQVAGGQADAFATDDVLLYGLIAQDAGKSGKFQVVGDYLSYDPYGIMFRKDDPQLAQVIKDSFQVLAEDGEIERQYKRWFLRKLPSGESLNLPMSAQMKTVLETMAVRPQ